MDGETIPSFEKGITVDLVIYKQFSFSGGNYITKVLKDSESNRRIYTKGDGSSYTFTKRTTGSVDETTFPLLPPQNIYQLYSVSIAVGHKINICGKVVLCWDLFRYIASCSWYEDFQEYL